MISAIAAISQNNVIGADNKLLWHIPEDFRWFKKHTKGHPVIMGRKTHESIGKLLPNRDNIVVTRNKDYSPLDDRVIVFNSLSSAIESYKDLDPFVIGGSEIYKQSMEFVDEIYLTKVHTYVDGDSYFPDIGDDWTETYRSEVKKNKDQLRFTFYIYRRRQ